MMVRRAGAGWCRLVRAGQASGATGPKHAACREARHARFGGTRRLVCAHPRLPEGDRDVYYARVFLAPQVSTAERHPDVDTARCWIDRERQLHPRSFRFGQIYENTPQQRIVATCDAGGWHAVPQDMN
jgi:hypothetical protein